MNDCAVVGAADELKGQVPVALLIVNDGVQEEEFETILAEVKAEVRSQVGYFLSCTLLCIVLTSYAYGAGICPGIC